MVQLMPLPSTDPIISCLIEIQTGLPFWIFIRVVLEKRLLNVCSVAHTRSHTHTFNGPFSGTTRVSRYQKGKTNLDFVEARDSEWQWHQLGHMQVCT